MEKFYTKYYSMSVQEFNDKLIVKKISNTDWSNIQMITNDNENGSIQLRSKAMAEQLHFMLGQMLKD